MRNPNTQETRDLSKSVILAVILSHDNLNINCHITIVVKIHDYTPQPISQSNTPCNKCVSTFNLNVNMDFLETVVLFMFVQNPLFVANGELVDMSFPYENNMATWPGTLAYNITLAHKGPFLKAPYAIAFNLELSEHTGTHIDAPAHFGKGQPTVDEIPPESLVGEAIVVNITEQALKEPDYELTVNDLRNWEEKHGRIPDGSILFVLTGFGKYWGDEKKYFGIKEPKTNATGHENFHWPGNAELIHQLPTRGLCALNS